MEIASVLVVALVAEGVALVEGVVVEMLDVTKELGYVRELLGRMTTVCVCMGMGAS